MQDISKLLAEAADIFSQLARQFEETERKQNNRIAAIEHTAYTTKETLRTVATAILDQLE
jgi:lactate dehydrogenase-like 2-hydroxyacid dehydrogenase